MFGCWNASRNAFIASNQQTVCETHLDVVLNACMRFELPAPEVKVEGAKSHAAGNFELDIELTSAN